MTSLCQPGALRRALNFLFAFVFLLAASALHAGAVVSPNMQKKMVDQLGDIREQIRPHLKDAEKAAERGEIPDMFQPAKGMTETEKRRLKILEANYKKAKATNFKGPDGKMNPFREKYEKISKKVAQLRKAFEASQSEDEL